MRQMRFSPVVNRTRLKRFETSAVTLGHAADDVAF